MWTCPIGYDQITFAETAREAVTLATKKGFLRQNSVDSLTGKNDGTNVGPGAPAFHFHQHRSAEISVKLVLKGGGCENVGAQYSLPDDASSTRTATSTAAARRSSTPCCRRRVRAAGRACSACASAVTARRATNFPRPNCCACWTTAIPCPKLDALEQDILKTANELGIGPMGFGGKTTLLGVKICVANRVPASYFVSISYMCWAYRRQGVTLDAEGKLGKWLY